MSGVRERERNGGIVRHRTTIKSRFFLHSYMLYIASLLYLSMKRVFIKVVEKNLKTLGIKLFQTLSKRILND